MKQVMICTMALSMLFSCTKKSTDQASPSPSSNPYFQADAGDYWIYKNYKIDSSGIQELPGTDSVVVSGDSIINGKKYKVLSGTNNPFSSNWSVLEVFRDSSGYLCDSRTPFFSSVNVNEQLHTSYNIVNSDTFQVYKFYMNGPAFSIQVPAGTFNVLNGVREVSSHESVSYNYPFANCYAPGVGLVMSQNSYDYLMQQGIYYEKRLLRYYIANKN